MRLQTKRMRAGLAAVAALALAAPLTHSQASTRAEIPRVVSSPTIMFSGYAWKVRNSPTPAYPGPDSFDATNAYLDLSGALHLKYTPNIFGQWSGAEIQSVRAFGYGTYSWQVASPLNNIDPNVVLGLFSRLPSGTSPASSREIDVEVGKFGHPSILPAQFVVQPASVPGHLQRAQVPGTTTSGLQFVWRPGRVDFSIYDATGAVVSRWTYRGSSVPPAGSNHLTMNLWGASGRIPSNGQTAEAVIKKFTFTPLA